MSAMSSRGSESVNVIARHVRADAWQLLDDIKATESKTVRRQLARRAFQLAQIAAQAELEAGDIASAVEAAA